MDFRDSDLYDDKKLLVRINTLNNMIKKRRERITNNELEIHKYQREMGEVKRKINQYTKNWKVNPQLKKKNQKKKLKDGSVKMYPYYQFEVRVWWKKSPITLNIGNEETYQNQIKQWKEEGKNIKEEWKKLGKDKFLLKLLTENIEESMKPIYIDLYGKNIKK